MGKYILFFLLLTTVFQTVSAQRDVRTNIRHGNRAYHQQNFSEAITFYENAISENPNSQEAIFNLGNALYRAGEWERAIEQFGRFIELEQNDPMAASAAWHNIGNALLRNYALQESLEAYKMALRFNPRDDETRYNLAVVQRLIRNEEDDGGGGGQDEEQEQQQQEQQQQQQQQNQNQRVEQPEEPAQMSRENARQILQAIEEDERDTQERVQQMRERARERQAEENRRLNRNW